MINKRFVRAVHDASGEIDGASHEQLVAMVQHTDPIAVMQVAQRLVLAANKMDEVSEELHAHMSGLDWEGAAADSFKTWGSQVSKSTMDLASYSRNAGEYMASAGQTLAEVKSGMPPVPHADMQTVSRYDDQPNDAVSTGGAILGSVIPGVGAGLGSWAADQVADAVDSDWVTSAEAKAAQQRVAQAHNEAIQQMNKLAQAYEQSTTQLNAVQPPVFPPLPDGKAWHDGSVDVPIGGGDGNTGRNPGGGTTLPQPPRVGPPPSPRPPQPPTPVPPPLPHPPQPPAPNPPHPPTPLPPGQDPGTRIDHTPPPAPTSPNPTVPGHGGGTGGGGIGGGGLGDTGGGSSGSGRGGGYPGGPIGGGPIGGGLGGGGASGTGRTGGGAPGTGGATGAGNRAGGTTATSGGAGQAGQAGRAGAPGMGGMGAGGMGAGGARGGAGGGAARGSGLVGRAGGTIGGQRGSASGREVTPGGTGLRGRAERGADGRAGQGGFGGGHGGASRKGKPQGKRPDYLTEDEDTWTSGMGPVNPNVIE
ncbi:WXG100 family type VII secretion target [Kitasatospora sp. NPDC059673]|uniref:WXG100 family type VII secretion target n=1 Tax=Kitasatospora sp. NPDC059673 TaxID=3346901 RepID=UPI0036B0613B